MENFLVIDFDNNNKKSFITSRFCDRLCNFNFIFQIWAVLWWISEWKPHLVLLYPLKSWTLNDKVIPEVSLIRIKCEPRGMHAAQYHVVALTSLQCGKSWEYIKSLALWVSWKKIRSNFTSYAWQSPSKFKLKTDEECREKRQINLIQNLLPIK